MHHWVNRSLAYSEINRVASDRFVAISWNPTSEPFWLTRDYFPEIHQQDQENFPSYHELSNHFDEVEFFPLLIPKDCQDGFMAAFWKRPEAYLDGKVRQSISSFAKIPDVEERLERLKQDLDSKHWHRTNLELEGCDALDAGYIIISAKTV